MVFYMKQTCKLTLDEKNYGDNQKNILVHFYGLNFVCGLYPYQIDNVFSNQSSVLISWTGLVPSWFFFFFYFKSFSFKTNVKYYFSKFRRIWRNKKKALQGLHTNLKLSARLLYFDIIFCIVRILHLLM